MAGRAPIGFVTALAGLSTIAALGVDALWLAGAVPVDAFWVATAAVFHAGLVGGWWSVARRLRADDDA